jgi:hypothetical protein
MLAVISRSTLRLLGTVLLTGVCTAHAQTTCLADFSLLGQGQVAVEIRERSDGLFDAVVNGVTTNSGGKVLDEAIRSGLDLSANPNSIEFKQLNSAERSLVHIYALVTNPTTRNFVKIQFSPSDVQRIKTFDLIGKTDKFGGQVLLEARGPGDAVLGRVVRRVLVVSCQ